MIQLCEAEPHIRLNSGHNMKYNTLLEANLGKTTASTDVATNPRFCPN